jgi:hypothetical protein
MSTESSLAYADGPTLIGFFHHAGLSVKRLW